MPATMLSGSECTSTIARNSGTLPMPNALSSNPCQRFPSRHLSFPTPWFYSQPCQCQEKRWGLQGCLLEWHPKTQKWYKIKIQNHKRKFCKKNHNDGVLPKDSTKSIESSPLCADNSLSLTALSLWGLTIWTMHHSWHEYPRSTRKDLTLIYN